MKNKKMRWSEKETCVFVKLYLTRDFLWNTEHASYKFKGNREKAYQDIITEFKDLTGIILDVHGVKTKIRNLRSTYSQELCKIKLRSRPEGTYVPTIKWFAEWHRHFTDPNNSRKYYDCKLEDEQPEEDSEEVSQKVWVPQDSSNEEEEVGIDPFISQSDSDLITLKLEPKDEELNNESEENYTVKRKKTKHRSPSSDQSERTFRGSMDSTVYSVKEDEFDIYGKYIATQLRKMDIQKALKIQLEIQSLVSEARLSDLSGNK